MCVIAVYKNGLSFNKEELERCFITNPHGAGVMYQHAKGAHIKKGFMDFQSLWEYLEKLPNDIDRVVHFRIATSGMISTDCCHPFPITKHIDDMRASETTCKRGLAHNGVMWEYTPKEKMSATYSDTMNFTSKVVAPLGENIFNEGVQNLLKETMKGNKYAIMDREKTILIGDFIQSEASGAYYSNYSYEEYLPNPWFSYEETCNCQYMIIVEKKELDDMEYDHYDFLAMLEEYLSTLNIDVIDYDDCDLDYYVYVTSTKNIPQSYKGISLNIFDNYLCNDSETEFKY